MKRQHLTWKIELIIISVFLIAFCGCHKTANNDQIQNGDVANNTASTEFGLDTVLVDDEIVSGSNADFETGSPTENPMTTLESPKATDALSPQSSSLNDATGASDSFAATTTPSATPSGGTETTAIPSPPAEDATGPESTSTPWDDFDQGEWDTGD